MEELTISDAVQQEIMIYLKLNDEINIIVPELLIGECPNTLCCTFFSRFLGLTLVFVEPNIINHIRYYKITDMIEDVICGRFLLPFLFI